MTDVSAPQDSAELQKTLEEMNRKTRELADALIHASRRAPGERQSPGDIVRDSLASAVKQQLTAELRGALRAVLPPVPKPSNGGIWEFAGGGGDGITVVINNNTSSVVTANETSDGPFQQRTLEITIDQMVASALVRGRQTTGVLGSLFNIVPGLIGR